jgi:DNA-binding GntR family transcriptional regulator
VPAKPAFQASSNLGEQITEYLITKIVTGDLHPGERILEARLAHQLDVSRGPIREALFMLERKGLVKLMPRRGAIVTEMSVAHVEWLYDVLIELYTLTARKVTANRTNKDLVQIRRALKRIQQLAAKGDSTTYYKAAFEFSTVLLPATKNPLLSRIISNLEPSVRRAQFASCSRPAKDLQRNAVFFQNVVRYIEEKNPDMACNAIRSYLLNEKEFALNGKKKGFRSK